MDREIPMMDIPTRLDSISATMAAKMMAAITPTLTDENLTRDEIAQTITQAVIGMLVLGERSRLALNLLAEMRIALDHPERNWIRFSEKHR